jgi:hypothetical protein
VTHNSSRFKQQGSCYKHHVPTEAVSRCSWQLQAVATAVVTRCHQHTHPLYAVMKNMRNTLPTGPPS